MTIARVDSAYDGPVRESRVVVGGHAIRLVRPAEPDRLLDDPAVAAWNAELDYMPYWAYLWPGSYLLGEAVADGGWPGGTQALEIGCGLGLPGLVAVAAGLNVRFTDYDLMPLRFVERSAAASGFDPTRFSTGLLDWRHPPADERYPLILGADVTYEARLVPLVAGVIGCLLAADGVALLSDPDRVAARGLADELATLGLACEATPVESVADELGPIRGMIHRVWRPGKG